MAPLDTAKMDEHLRHMWEAAESGDLTRFTYHGGNMKFLIQEATKAQTTRDNFMAAAEQMLAALQNIRTAHQTGHNESEAWGWVDAAIAAATAPATQDCPHAAPFRYCQQCKVTPCPIGLDKSAAAA